MWAGELFLSPLVGPGCIFLVYLLVCPSFFFDEYIFPFTHQKIIIIIIHTLCNLCEWKHVKTLLDEMLDIKVMPDVVTLSIMVNAFCNTPKYTIIVL